MHVQMFMIFSSLLPQTQSWRWNIWAVRLDGSPFTCGDIFLASKVFILFHSIFKKCVLLFSPLKRYLFLFFMYEYFVCLYIMHYVYAEPEEARRQHQNSWTGLVDGHEPSCECYKLKPSLSKSRKSS